VLVRREALNRLIAVLVLGAGGVSHQTLPNLGSTLSTARDPQYPMFFTDLTKVWSKQESFQVQIASFGQPRLTKYYVRPSSVLSAKRIIPIHHQRSVRNEIKVGTADKCRYKTLGSMYKTLSYSLMAL
jgi:hypothetical protein